MSCSRSKPLLKIPRSQLKSVTMKLLHKQEGVCLVCHKSINIKTVGRASDFVCDHDHETGEVRGILHRSCNSSLGKIDNAAGRWGAKSMKYEDILAYLHKVLAYYDHVAENPTGIMYPSHKTPEEKAAAAKLKRRKQNATKKAAAAVKQRKQS